MCQKQFRLHAKISRSRATVAIVCFFTNISEFLILQSEKDVKKRGRERAREYDFFMTTHFIHRKHLFFLNASHFLDAGHISFLNALHLKVTSYFLRFEAYPSAKKLEVYTLALHEYRQ